MSPEETHNPWTKLQRIGELVARFGNLGIASAAAMGISAINVALIARHLDPVIWGSTQLANRMLDFGHSMTLPGINESALISAARNKHGNYQKLIKLKWKAAAIAAFVLAAVGCGYLVAGEIIPGCMILMASVCFPWIAIGTGIPDAWMEGLGEIKLLGQFRIIRAVLGLTGLLGLLIFSLSPLFYIAPLIGMCLAAFYVFSAAKKHCINEEVDEELLRFGISLSPSRIVGGLLMSAEFLIVSFILGIGMEGIAAWAAALVLPNYFKMFLGNIQSVISRKIYGNGSLREKLAILLPWTRLWAILSAAGAMAALAAGQNLILLVLGDRWILSGELGSVLLACTIVVSVTDFYASTIMAERDLLFHNLSQYMGGVLTVVFCTIGATYYGIYGVCIAKISTMAALTLLRLIFMIKHRNLELVVK